MGCSRACRSCVASPLPRSGLVQKNGPCAVGHGGIVLGKPEGGGGEGRGRVHTVSQTLKDNHCPTLRQDAEARKSFARWTLWQAPLSTSWHTWLLLGGTMNAAPTHRESINGNLHHNPTGIQGLQDSLGCRIGSGVPKLRGDDSTVDHVVVQVTGDVWEGAGADRCC
jgi:hypothetical protein